VIPTLPIPVTFWKIVIVLIGSALEVEIMEQCILQLVPLFEECSPGVL